MSDEFKKKLKDLGFDENGYLADSHADVLEAKKVNDEFIQEKKEHEKSIQLETKDDEIVPLDGYPYIEYEGPMKHIPSQARKLMGCHNCEWRGTKMCPFGIKRYERQGKTSHAEGICEMRLNYLKNFYRGEKERPTFTEWLTDYNQGIAQLQLQDEYGKLLRIKEKLAEYEDQEEELAQFVAEEDETPEMKRYKALKKLANNERNDWFNLWKILMENDQKRIDRETPKKIEVDNKQTISVSDFQKLVRKANENVIDAEYEEIDE